jgi:hypothetical protein
MIVSPCLRAEWPEGPQAYEEGGLRDGQSVAPPTKPPACAPLS